jgi:large subunit ribosomal protein L13
MSSKTQATRDTVTINAEGESLGRLSARIATILRGKDLANFMPNSVPARTVIVYNTDKLLLFPKKLGSKVYRRHSGYPGGLKTISLKERMTKDSREVLREAVYGMLPKNKLRSRFITNLRAHKKEL